jgi:hypothetical protein
MNRWPRRKGIHAFVREKRKSQDRNSSPEFDQEETRWTGATEQETWEESENREDLALVCDGQQVRRLLGSGAVGRDARQSNREEQRGG